MVPLAGPLHERPSGFVPRETVEAMLSGALAGVELGAYDRRITRWLSGFNTEAVVVASLIRRAWAEGVRTGRVEACDETAAGRAESRLTDLADARVGSDRWWGYEALPAWWDGTGDAESACAARQLDGTGLVQLCGRPDGHDGRHMAADPHVWAGHPPVIMAAWPGTSVPVESDLTGPACDETAADDLRRALARVGGLLADVGTLAEDLVSLVTDAEGVVRVARDEAPGEADDEPCEECGARPAERLRIEPTDPTSLAVMTLCATCADTGGVL